MRILHCTYTGKVCIQMLLLGNELIPSIGYTPDMIVDWVIVWTIGNIIRRVCIPAPSTTMKGLVRVDPLCTAGARIVEWGLMHDTVSC